MWLIASKSMTFEIVPSSASQGMEWLTHPNLLNNCETEPVIHVSFPPPHTHTFRALDNWIKLQQNKSGQLYLHSLNWQETNYSGKMNTFYICLLWLFPLIQHFLSSFWDDPAILLQVVEVAPSELGDLFQTSYVSKWQESGGKIILKLVKNADFQDFETGLGNLHFSKHSSSSEVGS